MVVLINGLPVQRQGDPVIPGDFHGISPTTVSADEQPIALVGQLTTGHQGFPPTPAISGSPNVLIGGIPVVRQGDLYAPHTDGSTIHPGTAAPL